MLEGFYVGDLRMLEGFFLGGFEDARAILGAYQYDQDYYGCP